MTILIDTAELAGLAVEGVLYGTPAPYLLSHHTLTQTVYDPGIFLCLFCVCGYDLANRRGQFRRRLSWPMAAAGVLLILFATARFAVDCANIFTAFIRHDPRTARLGYLQDVKEPLFTTKHCLFIADLLVGDSFVVRQGPGLTRMSRMLIATQLTCRTIVVGSFGGRTSGSS